MTTPPINVFPGRLPRFRLNNITPLSYRDGLTYLQLIEEIRCYIESTLVAEVNSVIDDLNIHGEYFNEQFALMVSNANDELNNLVQEYQGLFNEAQGTITEALNGLEQEFNELAQTASNNNITVNQLIEQVNGLVEQVDEAIDEFNLSHNNAIEALDLRIQALENFTGVETIFLNLGSGATLIEPPSGVGSGQVLEYVVRQDSTGGRTVALDSTVSGRLAVKSAPLSETRFRLVPNGDGTWTVDQMQQHYGGSSWFVNGRGKTTVAAGGYSAYPVATVIPDTNRVCVAHARYTDHFGGGQAPILRSSATNPRILTSSGTPAYLDPSAPNFGVTGLSSKDNRYALMTIHNNPYRNYLHISSNVTSIPTGIPVTWQGSEWQYGCDIEWIDDGTANGILLATSYGGLGVQISQSTNLGTSWTHVSNPLPAISPSNWPYSESAITHLGGNRLTMATRWEPDGSGGNQHEIRVLFSNNLGATWTAPILALPNATGMPRITRMVDGTMLLTARSKNPNHAPDAWTYGVSHDGGYTWDHREIAGAGWMMYGDIVVRNGGDAWLYGAEQQRNSATNASVFAMEIRPGMLATETVTDSGWIPYNQSNGLNSGYTSTASYRVINGICYWYGVITRTAGNFTGDYVTVGTVPEYVRPDAAIRGYAGIGFTTIGYDLVAEITAAGVFQAAQAGANPASAINMSLLSGYPV